MAGHFEHIAASGITWCTTGVRLTIPSTVRDVHLDGRAGIDAALVRRLIATQFPQWRDQPVTPVAIDGWDNRTYRLGTQLSVRLPTAASYASAIEKEDRWLPILAPSLPVAVPVPLATGRPGGGYPFCWSVRPWLDGRTALEQPPVDLGDFAISIAEFLLALQRIDATDGPIAGAHSFYRGASPKYYDNETRECLRALRGRIDVDAAATVWDAALATTWSRAPVWFHGDVASGTCSCGMADSPPSSTSGRAASATPPATSSSRGPSSMDRAEICFATVCSKTPIPGRGPAAGCSGRR